MNVFFDTLGCLKNFNDSDMAMGILEARGHRIVESPEEADAIVVNTCGFIDDAKKESIGEIFDMAAYKEQGKKLIVSGCLVQRFSEELFKEIPEADGFIGVNDYEKLPDLLDQLQQDGKRFRKVEEVQDGALEEETRMRKIPQRVYSTSIRIAEGCDNRCTYCIIPSIRGKYRSRSMESIVEEASRLAQAGCRELNVIAQDTSYYGMDLYGEPKLAALLRKLAEIDGIQWIRILYCYEENITDELIQTMAEEPKICHYIDIPLQHSNDKVLREMNRRSTQASIRDTIHRLREAMPDICIRTTMIVGFPGETEEEFSDLMDFVREIRFNRLGAFTYSQEEGTPAAAREDQVPEEIKNERLDALMMEQMQISNDANQAFVGNMLPVMVDEQDEDGAYIGRTPYDAPEIDNSVIFTSDRELSPGDIVSVRIDDAFDYDLEGTDVSE
jgi:ribosomal protein S12 methylthiotransferase